MSKEYVILVDADDMPIGTEEKIEAHRKALLHRAISVFIINRKGEWLLQQRAKTKYHSGGLWTNTCCTHPQPGESTAQAARRRMMFEMGMECQIKQLFSFIYCQPLDNELTEHELDHVFIGVSDDVPVPNVDEVMAYRYVDMPSLNADMQANPSAYTVWFRLIAERVQQELAMTDVSNISLR